MSVKLKLSNDRKVSTISRWEKANKRWKPVVPNSFGLPAGPEGSCSDATDWCISRCYAANLQRAWSSVDRLVNHNLELLQGCGSNVARMVDLLADAVGSINWRDSEKAFRWHWNGDVFSKPYAHAIAETCRRFPGVQFWIYTRSFQYLDVLVGVPNLVVYLSVDEDNIDRAMGAYREHPSVLVAACGDDWGTTETIMRKVVGRNAPRCPELAGKIPLVTDDGVGACIACGMCVYGRNHVRFSAEKN